jgi:hypothetical protein
VRKERLAYDLGFQVWIFRVYIDLDVQRYVSVGKSKAKYTNFNNVPIQGVSSVRRGCRIYMHLLAWN